MLLCFLFILCRRGRGGGLSTFCIVFKILRYRFLVCLVSSPVLSNFLFLLFRLSRSDICDTHVTALLYYFTSVCSEYKIERFFYLLISLFIIIIL